MRRFRIGAGELAHENFESVERSQITNELRCQQLLFDNVYRDSRSLRRAPEPTPGISASALQIDDGDISGRSRRKVQLKAGTVDHAAQPKRFFRASRLVFRRVVMMVLTIIVGWPSAQNCTRHSTELPLPLALTSSVPT